MFFFKSERSDLFGDFTTCNATSAPPRLRVDKHHSEQSDPQAHGNAFCFFALGTVPALAKAKLIAVTKRRVGCD